MLLSAYDICIQCLEFVDLQSPRQHSQRESERERERGRVEHGGPGVSALMTKSRLLTTASLKPSYQPRLIPRPAQVCIGNFVAFVAVCCLLSVVVVSVFVIWAAGCSNTAAAVQLEYFNYTLMAHNSHLCICLQLPSPAPLRHWQLGQRRAASCELLITPQRTSLASESLCRCHFPQLWLFFEQLFAARPAPSRPSRPSIPLFAGKFALARSQVQISSLPLPPSLSLALSISAKTLPFQPAKCRV